MGGILWLPIALTAYLLFAVTNSIDRVVVHNKETKPAIISFWVAVFSVATIGILLLGLIPLPFFEQFRFEAPPSWNVVALVVIAGFINQVALFSIYRALQSGEVSRVTSVIGAITPIVTIGLAFVFLDERLSLLGFVAIFLLILGSVVLTTGGTKKGSFKKADWIFFAVLAATLLALQSVLMKIVFDQYHFISAYALTAFGALAYVGYMTLFSKDVRASLHQSPKKKVKESSANKPPVALIVGNAAAGSVAAILLNLALDLGSPTFVNALRGAQYGAVFIIVMVLSKSFPSLLDEELNRKIILLKLSGIVLVVNGVVLLAIQ